MSNVAKNLLIMLESAASSEEITSSVSQTATAFEQVTQSAQAQAELAYKLSELVSKFKI